MTRWTTCIIVALGGLIPALTQAQEPWSPAGGNAGGWHDVLACPPGGYAEGGAFYDSALLPASVEGPFYGHDTPLDLAVRETFARGWIRFDYLFFSFEEGGTDLLGAPILGTADLTGNDPLNRLPAVDPVAGARPLTFATVPNMTAFPMQDQNGIRGKIGLPTTQGTFEYDLWAINPISDQVNLGPRLDNQIPGVNNVIIPAVTLLANGNLSNTTMILFSDSYRAQYDSFLWGMGADWVFPAFVPNQPVTVSPILGFRYLQLDEELRISGQDTFNGVTLNHVIASLARNDLFGPELGLRIAATHGRLTLAAEPKFLVGINRIHNSVETQQLFTTTEPNRRSADTNTEFAPMFLLSAYGRLQATQRLSIFVGYDLMVGNGFSRAFRSIVYNTSANVLDPNAVSARETHTRFWAHGLMLGGEFSFR